MDVTTEDTRDDLLPPRLYSDASLGGVVFPSPHLPEGTLEPSTLLGILRIYTGSCCGLIRVTVHLSPPGPAPVALTLIRAMIQKAYDTRVPALSCGGSPESDWLDQRHASVWCWPRTLEAWNRWLPEVALAVLLAGKQLASDRKGSAMRGLSRAPKPTKKWRTWWEEEKRDGWGHVSGFIPSPPHFVSHLGSPCLAPEWGAIGKQER